MDGLTSKYFVNWLTSSSPATAVVAAVNPTTITAPTSARQSVPPRDLGIQLKPARPRSLAAHPPIALSPPAIAAACARSHRAPADSEPGRTGTATPQARDALPRPVRTPPRECPPR